MVSGSVCWGHITGVTETNIRTFVDNWTGTATILGLGDNEQIRLASEQYMESEIVETGVISTTLIQNNYASGDTVLLQYRYGATEADCIASSWNNYTTPFNSFGYVQVRVTPFVQYLLRDLFTTVLVTGSVDGTAAEPGVGLRDVNDVESKIFTTGGRLRGGGQDTPVWGESKVVWTQADASGWARKAGRALAALILPEDMAIDADVAFGWASATNIADPQVDGIGMLMQQMGEMHAITPGLTVKLFGDTTRDIRPMQYLVVLALNNIGGAVLLSTFGTDTGNARIGWDIPKYPLARVLWVEPYDTTTPLFPSVQYYGKIDGPATGYPNGNSLEDLRIIDVPDWSAADALATFADRFTRADSDTTLGANWTADGGVWGISSNKAYAVSGTGFGRAYANGPSDGIFRWDITIPASWDGTNAGFGGVMRRTDADNFIRIWNDMANTLSIQAWQGGAFHADILTTAQTWVAGQTYKIVVVADGNKYRVFIDDVGIGGGFTTDAGNHQLTGTGIGLYVNNSAAVSRETRWDNVMAYPSQVTLPASFNQGKIPTILTGGTVLAQDSFTDANDTNITAHTPEVGPAWTTDNTTWTIQSNKLDPALHATLKTNCVQDLGVTDAECEVAITLVAGCDRAFPGIVGRYVDSTHWIGVRIGWADYAPEAQEVELHFELGGNGDVRHKANVSNYYTAGSTHTLKMQFKGDLIQVFLDGAPILSYYTIAEDAMGTKFGLQEDYNGRSMEGHVFDSWVVKAL